MGETRTYKLLYSTQQQPGVWQEGGDLVAARADDAIEAFVQANANIGQQPGVMFIAVAESNWSPVKLEIEVPQPIVTFKPLTERPKRTRATAAASGAVRSASGSDAE